MLFLEQNMPEIRLILAYFTISFWLFQLGDFEENKGLVTKYLLKIVKNIKL
jgi:hypothetical protein